MKVTVDLKYVPKTESILLGYRIATFENMNYKGDIVASGKTLRIHVEGVDGYVDMDISEAAERAVLLLRGT